jgi:release factor glutamine methyltransferase
MELDPVVARLRTAGCVFAEEEAALLRGVAGSQEALEELVDRRVAGEPVEVVLGWVDFSGVRVRLDPGVFVPRQRTALMVAQAAALAPQGALVADLCCGSGAITLALLAQRPDLQAVAADIDPAAVACAERNLKGKAEVFTGDLFDALPGELRGRLSLVMANVPYVPSGELGLLPPEARDYEPRTALDGGSDGLAVVWRVAEGASHWLEVGGSLLVEVSSGQAEAGERMFSGTGLIPTGKRDDESGTVVLIGTRP